MKTELESIIENAKSLIELAEGDIDCFGDDFCADDYRKYLTKIESSLGKAETEHAEVMKSINRRPILSDKTIAITEKDWCIIRNALEAQQNECTPDGATMDSVVAILRKMPN